MKKNLDNITLNSVTLADEDLISVDSQKHICLLRENRVYQINADLKTIINNSENLGVKYIHKADYLCEEEAYKKFIPLKTLKEVYNIINQDYRKK